MTPTEAIRVLRERVRLFIPDGYRDDDGVWNYGPHKKDCYEAINVLEAELDRLQANLDDASESYDALEDNL